MGTSVSDIYIGIAVIWAVAVVFFSLARRVSRGATRRRSALLVLAGLGLVGLHSFVLIDSPALAWVLPVSSLVVVGNLAPLGAAWVAGVAWNHIRRPLWRRLLFTVPIPVLCAWHGYAWLFRGPPEGGSLWVDGVCKQTSRATCSAACAATVLEAHGIDATEGEMARLCLTRSWGTRRLGLYRGLKLKTRATPYGVEPFSWTFDELRRKPPGPVVLLVRHGRASAANPGLVSRWGWAARHRHTVVFFGFLPNGLADIGDPSAGRRHWTVDELQALWYGLGMRLVER